MEDILKNGVAIIRNVYTAEQISHFEQQYTHVWNSLQEELPRAHWQTIDYKHQNTPTFFLDKSLYQGKRMAKIGTNTVFELGAGRYNFDGGLEWQQFMTGEIQLLVDAFLKQNYTAIIGGLPLFPGAGDGGWHRDIGSLFEDETVDLAMPPFYITMIVPLTDVQRGQGCTEFITGSHRFNFREHRIDTSEKLQSWSAGRQCTIAEMRVGDVCIFSGLTVHRGTANQSEHQRDAIFIVFRKNWYSDDNPDDYNLKS